MHSVAHGELLGTRGFSEIGVSGRVNISAKTLSLRDLPPKQGDRGGLSFVKVISGFGGNNAALLLEVSGESPEVRSRERSLSPLTSEHSVLLRPDAVEVDGRNLPIDTNSEDLTPSSTRWTG